MKKALGAIGGLFFKTVDDEPTSQHQQVTQTAPTLVSQPSQTQSPVGQEDKEIKQQLVAALEQANLEGYDYFEFVKAIDAQAAIIPAEQMRFQSTFAMASTMGVNVNTLLSSAQHYLDVLSNKEKEFLAAMDKHANDAVGGKEEQIKQIDSQMAQKAEQIKALTQEINVLQEQKTVITNEISSNRIKIETVKTNFYATIKVITDRIKSDIDKIKQYLSPMVSTGGK
jgi:chromosome segregation ATPase